MKQYKDPARLRINQGFKETAGISKQLEFSVFRADIPCKVVVTVHLPVNMLDKAQEYLRDDGPRAISTMVQKLAEKMRDIKLDHIYHKGHNEKKA